MKKIFALAVLAVFALASCSHNTLDPQSQKARVINFSTVAGKATKAPITTNYFNHELSSFGVYAAYLPDANTWAANSASSTLYMGTNNGAGKEIVYNSTLKIWEPKEETYYWPLQGGLTFFAYWPYTLTSPSYTEGTTSFSTGSFTVNTTVAEQVDVLVSDFAANQTANTTQYNDGVVNSGSQLGVPIQFNHMLSQVVFTAAAATAVYNAGLSFKINSITVGARKTSASMTVTPGSAPVWADPTALQAFAVSTAAFPNATEATGAANFLTATQSAEIGDALLMIPTSDFNGEDDTDDQRAASDNDDEYIEITYTLYRMNPVLNMGQKTVKVWLNDNVSSVTNWEAGKKYTYQLTIDLEKIYFAPTVSSWTDATQAVPVPQPALP